VPRDKGEEFLLFHVAPCHVTVNGKCTFRSTLQQLYSQIHTPAAVLSDPHSRSCILRSTLQQLYSQNHTPAAVLLDPHSSSCTLSSTLQQLYPQYHTPAVVLSDPHSRSCTLRSTLQQLYCRYPSHSSHSLSRCDLEERMSCPWWESNIGLLCPPFQVKLHSTYTRTTV